MTQYTNEQSNYINYIEEQDTKLLACAGSGKTKCIIARIINLIENNIYSKDQILVLTFSKFTKDDFINKVKNSTNLINNHHIKTIDSFAKEIIDKDNKIDVSLLSYKFMKYLETNNPTNEIVNQFKILFIDEAQDLNYIQFNILVLLKQKFNIIINLIGDPNQNIYQFRNSSDKYLVNYQAKEFYLTMNFRSSKEIVNFSKYLRPFLTDDIHSYNKETKPLPLVMFRNQDEDLEKIIMTILNLAIQNNIDFSDIAILAPTRGKMAGKSNSFGLCLVSNILYKNKIKFKQFYNETSDEFMSAISYKPVPGHINILTYMGSKGLEWKHVILIDAENALINKTQFDERQHYDDKYLLYVACTRAIDNLFIISKYYQKMSQYHFSLNSWFNVIPISNYTIDDRFKNTFKFEQLTFKNITIKETNLTKIIDNFTEDVLDNIATLISYDSPVEVAKNKFYNENVNVNLHENITFLNIFLEHLFFTYYNMFQKKQPPAFNEIEKIINYFTNTHYLVEYVPSNIIKWYYLIGNKLSWKELELPENIQIIPPEIMEFITKKFNKNADFNKHILTNNLYKDSYISNYVAWITKTYYKYINCKNIDKIKKYVFNVIVIIYSLNTQHFYHMASHGKKFKTILKTYDDLCDQLKAYVEKNINTNSKTPKFGIGRLIVDPIDTIIDKIQYKIDLKDQHIPVNNFWKIKTNNDISLKAIIYMIYVNLINNKYIALNNNDEHENGECIIITNNYINLLKGEELIYKYKINKSNVSILMDYFR